jgi:Ca2+ transporting ATPase
VTSNQEWAEMLKIGACVDSTANLLPEEKGSSTEISLLKFMAKLGVNYSAYREMYPTTLKYPFSSSRKRMSVLLNRNSEKYLFVKGASEMVLGCCNKWYDMKSNRVETIP